MSVPEDVELQVVQDTPTLRHLVLPVAPANSSSLSEAELALLSGGDSVAVLTNAVDSSGIPPSTIFSLMIHDMELVIAQG